MFNRFAFRLFSACAACAACLAWQEAAGQAVAVEPPYQIILRSRNGVVTPERNKNGQTGGGYIQVIQVEPNQVLVLMRGAAAAGSGLAGSGHKGGSAAMQLELHQDFDVVPTRTDLRPPRMIVSAWLIGTLGSSQDQPGGTAGHSPACAVIKSEDQPLFNVCIKPHSVADGQNLLVNDRVGPMEMTIAPGGYHLHQTFAINAFQPKICCHSGSAAADFDPDPRLDSRWTEVLKPFRAAPHRDFGFRVIFQVVEEPKTPGIFLPETLPTPRLEEKEKLADDEGPAKP
ncbi:MAG TPA: hypothetical protein VH575_10005 [Gemmataceae bacterium]|jgi:hypothetical protein